MWSDDLDVCNDNHHYLCLYVIKNTDFGKLEVGDNRHSINYLVKLEDLVKNAKRGICWFIRKGYISVKSLHFAVA